MFSKEPSNLFATILENIARIERFTDQMDFEAFADDERTIYAVRAALIELAEAARRLGAQGDTLCPGIPWKDVRQTGNILRHGYDAIDLDRVWKTVGEDLPVLKCAVEAALRRLRAQPMSDPSPP